MKRIARMAALALCLCGATGAPAAERLTGEQIRRVFEGNTVTGLYTGTNLPFSEYHHADGRASGHNRHLPNEDACWTTTADAVCYYYGPQEKRRTYCFTIETSGDLYVIRSRPSGRINGLARIEKGDPHGYAKKRSDWACDGLISQAPGRSRAFSSEVDTGSREENAIKQKLGIFPRFGETRKYAGLARR